MLAKYNIDDSTYKQTTDQIETVFSETYGWEYIPGPKEIDIQTWGGDTKILLNNYILHLQKELGDQTLIGSFITLKELEKLGCTIPADFNSLDPNVEEPNCLNSPHYSWLIIDQLWWTRSSSPACENCTWSVESDGIIVELYNSDISGVRPVITISKDTLRNLNQ